MNRTIVGGRVLDGGTGSGLEGIPVSNGEDIVDTDPDGRYSLGVDPEIHGYVMLTLPDGYRAIGGFYRHLASGRKPLDFELIPYERSTDRCFSLAQITDTHLTLAGNRSWTGKALREDLEVIYGIDKPDFVVATGDLTSKGEISQLEIFRKIISAATLDVVTVFGGHDGNSQRFAGNPGETFVGNYEKVLGPAWFSFDYGGRHFISYLGEDYFLSPEDTRMKELWFSRDLERHDDGRDIVILMHTSPTQPFLEVVSKYNVKLILHGHWHSSKVFRYGKALVASTPPLPFGGIDTSPRGYRLVTFGETGFTVRLRHVEKRAEPTDGAGEAPQAIWSTKLSPGLDRSTPVFTGEDLLLGMSDENDCASAGVLCIGTGSGRARWNFVTDSSIKNSVAYDGGRDVCAAISVCGTIYVIEATSGQMLWSEALPGHPHRWIFTSPAVDDGVVFAGAKSGYAAVDIEDGSMIWYSELEGNDAWCCYASPETYRNLLVVMVSRRGILALGKSDGAVEWETELSVEYHYAPHLVQGDRVLTGGEREELVLLDAGTGEIEWRGKLAGRYPTSLSMNGGYIYATTSEGSLQCFDLKTGAEVWTYQSGPDWFDMSPYIRGGRSILARPLVSDSEILLPGCDGFIHVIDSGTGGCRGRINLGSPITAGPCRTDRGICIGTRDGNLYLFEEDQLG